MKNLLCAMLVVLCSVGGAWADENIDKGMELFGAGKYTDAMIAWKKAVEEGDGNAAAMIGHLYQEGSREIPKNPEKAVEWYQKGIDMGSDRAKTFMAFLYVAGYEGIFAEDKDKAYALIKGLDTSEDSVVLNNIYKFYMNGWGTPVDFAKAREIASRISYPKSKQNCLDAIDEAEKANTPIPAKTLITEVQQNQLRFDKNYKGKRITVVGYVGVLDAQDNGYRLQLFGTNDPLANPFSVVDCRFNASQEDALLDLNKGQSVKIKGDYKGKQAFQLGAFMLFNCEVLK
jgi:hypothetical protein